MSSIRIVLCALVFSYWLFPVYLAVLPPICNQLIYNVVPIIYLLLNKSKIVSFIRGLICKKYFYISMLLLIFFIIWSAIVLVINTSHDYSYFRKILTLFREVYIFIFLFTLSSKIHLTDNYVTNFSMLYGLGIFICVNFTIYTLFNPDFRAYWQGILITSDKTFSLVENAQYITRFSIGGFAGYGATILCSISVLLSCYLIKNKYKIGIVFVFFSLLGNMFYGRIGILMSTICLVFMLFSFRSVIDFFRNVIIIVLVVCAFYIMFNFIDDPRLDLWISWLIQPLDSFFTGLQYGYFTLGSSGDKLAYGMYFLPDFPTLIFGDGRYTNGDNSYYMYTDAGYMRLILYSGIIGMLLLYLSFCFLSICAVKNLKYARQKNAVKIVFIAVLMLFIEEYKGDAFEILFGFVSVLLLSSIMSNRGEI